MRVLQFSVFELDEASGELSRGGRRVALTHQAFVVLSMLASRSGAVVTREELRRALWPDGTNVDFERGLNFAVASLRRVLHDDARRPQFVETVTKRGYRFIAEVRTKSSESIVTPTEPLQIETVNIQPTRPRWSRSFKHWAIAAVIPVMCAQGSETVRAHTRATATPQSIAAFERGDYESAIAFDSRFAEAHFALAARYRDLGESRAIPQRVAFEQSRAAIRRAIALEDMPESRSLMGSLRLALDWDVDGARRDIARALESAPNWDIGLATYADVLSAGGDDDAALAAIDRAIALSPSCDMLAWQSAVLRYRARQFDTALAELNRARQLGPQWGRGDDRNWLTELHDLGLQIYVQQGRWRDAQREAMALAALHGGSAESLHGLAQMTPREAVGEFFKRSVEILQSSREFASTPPSRLALANARAGRTDDALVWLERAAESRDAELLVVLRAPAFDSLRGSSRYHAIVIETRRVSVRAN